MRPLIPVATLLVGVAIGGSIAWTATPPVDHSRVAVSAIAEALYTPCLTEDSPDCYWDALAQGNGRGMSFVTIAGHVFYAPLTPQ